MAETKSKDKYNFKTELSVLLEFLLRTIGYGFPLNVFLTTVFGLPFTLFSWIGYGIGFWFLEFKLTKIVRSIFFR